MSSLTVRIRKNAGQSRKVVVEMDADRFEKLAADLGFFSPEFLASVARAEKDIKAGRVRKINSLKELRDESS